MAKKVKKSEVSKSTKTEKKVKGAKPMTKKELAKAVTKAVTPKKAKAPAAAKPKKDKKAQAAAPAVRGIQGLGLVTSHGVKYDDLRIGAVVELLAPNRLLNGIVVGLVDNLPKKWFAAKTHLADQEEIDVVETTRRLDEARVLVLPFGLPESAVGSKLSITQLNLSRRWELPISVKLVDIGRVFGTLSGSVIHGKTVTQPWVMPVRK